MPLASSYPSGDILNILLIARESLILHRFSDSSNREQRFARLNWGRDGGGRGSRARRGTWRQVPGFVPVRACVPSPFPFPLSPSPIPCVYIPMPVRMYRPAPTRCIQGISLTNPLIIPGGRRPGRILQALRVCIPRVGPTIPLSPFFPLLRSEDLETAAWGPGDR